MSIKENSDLGKQMIYPERISKNELLELPLLQFPGKIHLVNDRIKMERLWN